MVEAHFTGIRPLVNKSGAERPAAQQAARHYGLNGVFSFFFTGTPLICT